MKKRDRGRPRIRDAGTKAMYVYLSPAVRDRVEKLAGDARRSLSAQLSLLVERGLEAAS